MASVRAYSLRHAILLVPFIPVDDVRQLAAKRLIERPQLHFSALELLPSPVMAKISATMSPSETDSQPRRGFQRETP